MQGLNAVVLIPTLKGKCLHAMVLLSKLKRVGSLLQVGASNELPESEELDALYDRFLIRREVRQVRTGL